MEKYDYKKAMKNDIREYIEDHYTADEIREHMEDRRDWEEQLNDDMWVEDSVTGNASGSYTFNTYKAAEYICTNLDLLAEAAHELGNGNIDVLHDGAESCDVTIRCYLLYSMISAVLNEIENEIWEE